MLKNMILLILLIAASRFIGLPSNFSPLLAFAIFIPRLTDNVLIQNLLPVTIVVLTNLFLEPVNSLILAAILLVFSITPAITRYTNNLFYGSFAALLIWHIIVNAAVWINSGGSLINAYIAAFPFDFKLAISTFLYLLLFNYAQRFWTNNTQSNSKFLDWFRD